MKKASDLKIGDTIRVPLEIEELRIRAGSVTVQFVDGSAIECQPDDLFDLEG